MTFFVQRSHLNYNYKIRSISDDYKGSMSSMDLSAIERAKIDCAEKLFNSISTANVKYHKVATYQDLIDGMNAIG